jgi:hypothetical protein
MKNHQMLYIEMSGCIYYTFSMVYILYFDTNSYPSSYHSSLNMGSELDTRHQLHEVYFLCADARRTTATTNGFTALSAKRKVRMEKR